MGLNQDFSVLLSVYRKERPAYLEQALSSIWDEQTLKPSQIVFVKDGPLTVELDEVVGRWQERLGSVFCVVSLEKNVGLARALNHGLEFCAFDLVARMDTDDIAVADRFQKQYAFMLNNPEIAVCSGQMEEWSEDFSNLISVRRLPLVHEDILKFAKRRSPISHPAVMFRKQSVMDVGGYPTLMRAQDYLLWVIMLAKGYRFANLPDILLKMRVGDGFLERRGSALLKIEIVLYKHLYKIGFINRATFFVNCLLRAIVRLSPLWARKLMYKNFR